MSCLVGRQPAQSPPDEPPRVGRDDVRHVRLPYELGEGAVRARASARADARPRVQDVRVHVRVARHHAHARARAPRRAAVPLRVLRVRCEAAQQREDARHAQTSDAAGGVAAARGRHRAGGGGEHSGGGGGGSE